ncbi:sugar ABC transporter permease [Promicromonospora sukumoe]|uniref:Multiple sugar transport system permease protein n=1 Tax=Promicromonospora sukumoe TaxID=88382 RepID=A0A7W3J6Q5_9MICO|nr:sugar ABC transporter permease [Promicromonospora sukumoe]MBA8807263.1 multiple sugar transport system permease protein [Promicromonospora sukumoe]
MAISTTTPARAPRAAGSDRTTGPVRRAGSPAHRGDARLAWVLVAPAIVGFLVFAAYPTLRGIYLSFTDFRVLTPPQWTGLDNLRRLVADEVFWHSLGVTAYFVLLSVVIGMALSVATAVVLHRLTASTALRGIIILPFLISGVVAATTWSWMLDAQLGIVNIAIRQLGLDPVFFLGSSKWAIPTIALISVWKGMGYNAIIVFAGLQTIPPTIYEAGRIDGANEIQMFRRLTLPLLRPVLAMVLVLTVIGSFQVFDLVAVTTQGGPARASNVLQLYIYDKAFGQFEFGYAATMSLALFAMLIAITFLQMRLLRADESDTN